MGNWTPEPAGCIVPPDMRLYQIDERIRGLIDPETGEVVDWQEFEKLQIEREEALEGIALLCREKQAVIATAKEEKKRFESIAKRAEYQLERLIQLLDDVLNEDSSFSTGRVTIRTRKTTSIEITDESAAEEWLRKYPETWQYNITPPVKTVMATHLSKKGLAEVLANHNIPGVVERTRRSVRVE